jgi:surfactin synthase thioesterase subunit
MWQEKFAWKIFLSSVAPKKRDIRFVCLNVILQIANRFIVFAKCCLLFFGFSLGNFQAFFVLRRLPEKREKARSGMRAVSLWIRPLLKK